MNRLSWGLCASLCRFLVRDPQKAVEHFGVPYEELRLAALYEPVSEETIEKIRAGYDQQRWKEFCL